MDELRDSIYGKIWKLGWFMRKRQMMNRFKFGPLADRTSGQGRVLTMLKMQNEITTKDLGYILGIRQQSLNETLNKLERKGYIVREPAEDDKRVMVIRLTDEGKQAEQSEQAEGSVSEIFKTFSEQELSDFGKYLDKMIDALKEQIGADEPMPHWGMPPHIHEERLRMLRAMKEGMPPCRRRRHHALHPEMPEEGRFPPIFDGFIPMHGIPHRHHHWHRFFCR